jgi:hypothetical protein
MLTQTRHTTTFSSQVHQLGGCMVSAEMAMPKNAVLLKRLWSNKRWAAQMH